MRIAMVSTPFVAVPPARYGGTELVVAALVDSLVEDGNDVVLYATRDSRTSAELRAVYDAPVWPPNPYDELAHVSFAIGDIVASERPFDVVHVHSPAALALARFVDAPVVYTLHHDRSEALRAYYHHMARGVISVAISRRQCELLPEARPRYVVHHGVDATRYPRGAGAGGYAAFLGRLSRCKGPHAAIDAARLARVPLRLAGRPHWDDHGFYEEEMAPRLAGPGATLIGEVGHDEKVGLLGGAIATLVPIDWEEPFGLVLVESMLCGTPVLAFPRGAVPELIDEGVTGFVVHDVAEMAERLARLASGGFDRTRCRARAELRFSAERMADDYLTIYRRARVAARAPAAVSELGPANVV